MSETPTMSSVASDSSSPVAGSKDHSLSRESALALAFLTYRVSRGDSLAELAARFGVSQRELVFDNRIRDRSLIFRGQKLKIRDKKRAPERDMLEYEVKRGDSIGKIARRLNESERKLVEVNKIKDPNFIVEGQIVLVPPS